MMQVIRYLLASILLYAAISGSAFARDRKVPVELPAPRIGVVTMGPGEIFWERFGHDAIVVDDPSLDEPISYNFGFFDMEEAGFIQRFLRGQMEYMLVALPLAQDMQYYRQVGRGARIQWLALKPEQARQLAADLAENAKPENARYRYDYYKDNCATRVRDALDHALDGQLKQQMDGRSSGDTYRSESLRMASPAPWMWLGFDIVLGPYADRRLTRWEQEFLPQALSEDLRKVTAAGGKPVLMAEQELLPSQQATEPQPQATEPQPQAQDILPWLLSGMGLAIVIVISARFIPRVLAVFASIFWLLCGIIGLVLAFAWVFTDHQALWANRNLLLFNPLCLCLLPGALCAPPPSRRFELLLRLIAVLAALACLPLWLQAFPQQNGAWIALLLPIHVGFALVWSSPRRVDAW